MMILDGLPYSVLVTEDGPAEAARIVARRGAACVVVFDRRIASRAAAVRAALEAQSVRVLGERGLAAGERRKTLRSATDVMHWLTSLRVERGTLLLAVGGGTLTDLAGFVAATYLRGLAWLPVATTVLGMVDAAIGGKTGVDLPEGKNLVGAFWDPVAVIGDLGALDTLPRRQRSTGMAEIVKSGIIGDPALFEAIERRGMRALDAGSIGAAARVKIAIVAADPRDSGARAALNLGHTIGHALEAASLFRMSHGETVAVGLRAAGMLAMGEGLWSKAEQARLLRALTKCRLPVHFEGLSVDAVVEALGRDKKRVDGEMRFVLPVKVGEVRVGVRVNAASVRAVIERCGSPPTADGTA
ncbi:MAG TPA: 3-dehydroquinate synthase family protein [Candidatus Tumulicola sp.]|nr:3-dehydroquinate synthase family protein [Candidatus Tumulicola sp.]